MPLIKDVNEEAESIKLDGLNDITIIDHAFEHFYNENYFYHITYDRNQNGRIINLVGFPQQIESFFVPDIERYGVALVNINKDQYEILKYSFESKDLMTFYDEENDEIFYRRLKIELLQGKFDNSDFSFYNDDSDNFNKIRIKIIALDSNDNVDDDIKEIHLKKLRAGGDNFKVSDATLNLVKETDDGEDLIEITSRKAKINNESIIEIDMNNSSIQYALLRFKAYVPDIDTFWLSIYPKFKKLDTNTEEQDLT